MNPATMTPEQLAEAGIPAIVALRARLADAEARLERYSSQSPERAIAPVLRGEVAAYRDALAILEAKSQ
jgi:hypothetical protein